MSGLPLQGNVSVPKDDFENFKAETVANNALKHGIKGDGTDETTAINEFISTHAICYFPKPPVSYTISDSLNIIGTTNISDGKNIVFDKDAVLKQTANKPCFKIMGQGHKIIPPRVDLTTVGTGYSEPVVLLFSESALLPCLCNVVSEIRLKQPTKNGIAIGLQTINDGYCYYNRLSGYIGLFAIGLKIDSSSANGINNNTFNLDINSAQQLINIVGGNGNRFSGRMQATTRDATDVEKACIYVDGTDNDFDVVIFDVGNVGLMKYAYEFSATALNNVFNRDDIVKNKSTVHYSNTSTINTERITTYKKIINMFACADQTYNKSYGKSVSPDYISEYYERYIWISPESNSLADKRNVSSVVITPINAAVYTGLNDKKDLFNHNSPTIETWKPILASQPSSITIDVVLTSPEQLRYVGLVLGTTLDFYSQVDVSIQNATTLNWFTLPPLFGNRIKTNGTLYNEVDKYSNGSDVIFSTDSLNYNDYSNISAIKIVLSLPAIDSADITIPVGYYFSVPYLYVNCRRRKNTRSNNAYPYIGGDTFTGDVKFSSSAIGPIIKDTVNGHTYRIQVTNGVITLQQVT